MHEILHSLPPSERESAIDRLIEAIEKKPCEFFFLTFFKK
jgi:effector-binding domain-containing protein